MKFIGVFFLCAALLAAIPAQGQIMATDPDVIGFFADPVGNVPGVCEILTPQTVFLMITRPSDPSGLTAYRCRFEVPPTVISMGFVPAGGIIITDTFPILDLGYTVPLPWVNETYTLGTWTLLLLSTNSDWVLLGDSFPSDSYNAAYRTVASGLDFIPVRPADWGNGMPTGPPLSDAVLWLNEMCVHVIANVTTSWGDLKSLWR